jgi:PPK2 family polyphosphate:nucleotide phosphotransferase
VWSNSVVAHRWLVPPGKRVAVGEIDPASTAGAPGGKTKTVAVFPKLHAEQLALQARLWAEGKRSLLVVLQGMDASGKDGAISHVFKGVNPQATRAVSFKVPSAEELAHDFLWRVHRQTPAAGETAIFNRSHYEDVLIGRVHGLVPPKVWKARYDTINEFERGLTDAGTRIVKVFLHISADEQLVRFRARLDDPTKRWKFNTGDLEERKLWNDYMRAYEDTLSKTSTEHAPWSVVPADHKWYRNWAISRIVIDTLRDMDPTFPEPKGLDGIELV